MADRNNKSVRARFSAAADTYDAHATVQKDVAERLSSMLPENLAPARILEVGCGTGLLTKLLLKRFPAAQVDAIDISDRMIQRARTRFADESRIRWCAEDAAQFKAKVPYRLVASSCSMHWLPHLLDATRHVASLMDPKGTFAFAIMVYGTLAELRDARLRVAPHKPPLRRLPTASEVRECLRLAGLRIDNSEEEYRPAAYPSARSFLQTLHNQGLTGGEVSRAMLPLRRQELVDLAKDYEEHYAKADGEVYASYRVLYVTATKTP